MHVMFRFGHVTYFKPDNITKCTMNLSWLLFLSSALTVLSQSANDSLLWGPYRSNLYFGLRPRIPQSLMTGLMWFGTHDFQSVGSKHCLSVSQFLYSIYVAQISDIPVSKGTIWMVIPGQNMTHVKEAYKL